MLKRNVEILEATPWLADLWNAVHDGKMTVREYGEFVCWFDSVHAEVESHFERFGTPVGGLPGWWRPHRRRLVETSLPRPTEIEVALDPEQDSVTILWIRSIPPL